MPIVSERFRIVTPPEEGCTLDDFRKTQPQKSNIFLELGYLQKEKKLIDVVLIEKVNYTEVQNLIAITIKHEVLLWYGQTYCLLFVQDTGKMYSGLYAHDLIKKHFSGAQVLDDVKWKVFLFHKLKSSLRLTNTTQVLCQVTIIAYNKMQ